MMIFGDDFVKNLPSLNIRKNYNLLLDIYKKIIRKMVNI